MIFSSELQRRLRLTVRIDLTINPSRYSQTKLKRNGAIAFTGKILYTFYAVPIPHCKFYLTIIVDDAKSQQLQLSQLEKALCDRELHCIRTDLASKRNFILCGRCYLVYIFHPKKQKHSCPKSQFVSSAMCIHTWCHSILYNSYVIRTFQKKKMTYIVNNRHLTTLTNCIDKDISNTENTYYAEFIDIDLVLQTFIFLFIRSVNF